MGKRKLGWRADDVRAIHSKSTKYLMSTAMPGAYSFTKNPLTRRGERRMIINFSLMPLLLKLIDWNVVVLTSELLSFFSYLKP